MGSRSEVRVCEACRWFVSTRCEVSTPICLVLSRQAQCVRVCARWLICTGSASAAGSIPKVHTQIIQDNNQLRSIAGPRSRNLPLKSALSFSAWCKTSQWYDIRSLSSAQLLSGPELWNHLWLSWAPSSAEPLMPHSLFKLDNMHLGSPCHLWCRIEYPWNHYIWGRWMYDLWYLCN